MTKLCVLSISLAYIKYITKLLVTKLCVLWISIMYMKLTTKLSVLCISVKCVKFIENCVICISVAHIKFITKKLCVLCYIVGIRFEPPIWSSLLFSLPNPLLLTTLFWQYCPNEIPEKHKLTGLEKLGFLVHKSLCSSKQVQENVVCLVILCTLRLYKVHAFTSLCTSSCTK